MQVAVARMAPAAGGEPVPAADLRRRVDRLREALERNDDILAGLPAAGGAHRERDAVAPAPERVDLRGRRGRVHGERVLAEDVGELRAEPRHLLGRAVHLGQDHEGPVGRRPRPRRQPDGLGVEVLERRHIEPAADHALDRRAAGPSACVEGDDGRGRLRRREQPQPYRGDDAERALGPDEQAAQVVAGHVLAERPSDGDDLAGSDDGLEPGHPRAGDAVLERVRAARVRRDVAADLRLLGGAGVGREEQPALPGETAHARRRHAGVDVGAPEERLEGADAVQPFQREHDAAQRHGAAGVARPASPRHDRDVALVAPRDDLGDLLGRARERDGVGMPAEAAALGLVDEIAGRDALRHRVGAEQRAQLARDRRHSGSNTTCTSRGPCTPTISFCSMSALRLGPVTIASALGRSPPRASKSPASPGRILLSASRETWTSGRRWLPRGSSGPDAITTLPVSASP